MRKPVGGTKKLHLYAHTGLDRQQARITAVISKKMQKKFAYLKKKQYLCTADSMRFAQYDL